MAPLCLVSWRIHELFADLKATLDTLDSTQDPPLPDPPEPAPGDPLLTDNDNRLLDSFFQDINADHYNMPSFGEGLNF
ncbi:hypothetical protein N0V84_012569, partial [Fusarium piperis]